jgi:aldehyde dehydrogenase (NAD+)
MRSLRSVIWLYRLSLQGSSVSKIRDTLRATFSKGITKPLAWRRHQLLQLARMMQENPKALIDAIYADLGRSPMETYLAEISPILERAMICAEKLEEWAKPEEVDVPDWQQSWSPTIRKMPKGTVLIIS